ncbi:MAG: hypothetical protein A2622_09890 [Bdellovibrionales bacterium RIFCSPHIGHO2_01_FULL_40_29]|nr:MAG: hypothetical protein A2622_09890 [Bdellovibrionales bacterium RIFCSPHIGHO2_01_FULL_40_29]OFZ32441.1 MAG: hypothetical protein A3D17_12770 [Bdellovibrionales bacterium RIFCSPHIGHO2_02_FULL_40_15]
MKPIYLDYNATTPTDPEVVATMLPYFTEKFGNPANTLNAYGWTAESAVKTATGQVAKLIHCKSNEIIWNAGATEGNNSVVFGLIRKLRAENPNEKIHFLTSATEHLSVINSFLAAKKYEGIDVDFMPVQKDGTITPEILQKWIKPHTKLVSIMWVNNEIGSINPISELAPICNDQQIYFHTDATQAVGKIDVNLEKTPVHFLTFSAHKLYGPKGVGCLFTRSANPHVEIVPYLFGGGHQHGQRSGTLNVPGIVGAGKACEMANEKWLQESQQTQKMLQKFYEQLKEFIPTVSLNGPELERRSPINLSLTMNSPIELALPQLTGLAFSQGSACSTTEVTSSHVLKAIGLSLNQAQNTIRLSIGRWTTEAEMNQALEVLIKVFKSQ